MRKRMSAAAAAVLFAGLLGGCGGHSPTPLDTLRPFLDAWNARNWTAMSGLVNQPAPDFATTTAALTSDLDATTSTHTVGSVTSTSSTASAQIDSAYQIPYLGRWSVVTTVGLTKRGGRWYVDWSPSVVDRSLSDGDRLVTTLEWPARAPILGAGGAALTVAQPQTVVGVEGSRIKNSAQLTTVLEAAGAPSTAIAPALAAAKAHPTYFEPVFQISTAMFDQMGGEQSQLYLVAGTVFQHTTQRAALTPGLAAHLVGTTGPITAQELQTLGPPYDASSTVGQTGLEQAYQKQLAGTPGATVTAVNASGKTLATLASAPPQAGTAVSTSIDPAVQEAAESALKGVAGNVAMVALDASTGQILASVSQPAANQFDQALDGQFPPGSTFKMITASGLIEGGFGPSSAASCPSTATVDGEVFHNAEGDAPVSTMAQAFTESCNTAFVQLAAQHLPLGTLPAVAAQYGIGTAPQMGLDAAAGSVPEPKDDADLAATAIGQAAVLVSPLNMAEVVAAIDSGSFHPVRLVAGAPDDQATPKPIPEAVVSGLRTMMASVVTSGTAAGTGLPAGTFAKTGTAQYGSGNPLPTDAWLVGYRANLAFAIVVVDSKGNGGPVDGPIIAKFLDALPSS